MKNKLLSSTALITTILFALFYPNKCVGQTIIDNKITIGVLDSINSKILNEKRSLLIYVPKSFNNELFTKRKYPVLYLLDGEAHFVSVVGLIDQLSQLNADMACPEMIVVGIINTFRTRDLSPSNVIENKNMDSLTLKSTGGGENFTQFIEKELIPYINSQYPTSPYKMLVGHSLGGLLTLNTLVSTHSYLIHM